MNSIYQIVTENIIEKLEQGTVPWRKTWNTALPKNFVTNIAYKGINTLLLGMQEFNSCYWLTFNQCKDLQGWVKKNQKATMVVYWKQIDNIKDDELNENRAEFSFLLRYYNVFNIEQVELPDELLKKRLSETKNEKIISAESIIQNYTNPPTITINNIISSPRYLPRLDRIEIQSINNFISSDEYYASLFHELIHSTGHSERLNRKGIVDTVEFGSEKYSKEELIAEIGASFLCSVSGVKNTVDNQASYIENWLRVLNNDRRIVLIAASQAQKSCDYILNHSKIN